MTIKHSVRWNETVTDHVKKVELEEFIVNFTERISMLEFEGIVDVNVMLDHLVLKVQRILLKEHPGPPSVDVTYPSTWWQHFKQDLLESRWCPFWTRWLIKKYPVRYTARSVDVNVLYSKIQPQMPGSQYILCLKDMGITNEKEDRQ